MGKGWLALAFLGTLPFALAASEPETPAPREVNLVASDGTTLKATYFAAAKEGPGVVLMHQCNQQRKVWDDLAKRMAALFELTRADGHETLEADCELELVFDRPLTTDSAAAA